MLCAFGHRVATCCDELTVDGSSLKRVQFEPTTPNISQHIATRWANTRNMLLPAMLRYVVLACSDRLAEVLLLQMKRGLVLHSDEGLKLETSAFESFYGGQFTLSTLKITPNYLITSEMFYAHTAVFFTRREVSFMQEVSGVYTSLSLNAD